MRAARGRSSILLGLSRSRTAVWSSWEDDALREMDGLIGHLDADGLSYRTAISILFTVTGPIQETAMSSGWGDEFLVLADRCDAAVAKVYRKQ